jgi:alpha-mannosidase
MDWHCQIISHTHWDREWYLNSKYTTEWTTIFFDRLFAMFEKEKDYQFVLDGQMLLLDDYFEELKKQGKPVSPYKKKIKKYVGEGRLHIGPYYLQPDWQLVAGESLVRNALVGTTKAREFGTVMPIGWLLDNFGQISQTSQINAKSGIAGQFVWRGVEMDPTNVKSEFNWKSPDGTSLVSVYLLNSYRNLMRLAQYKDMMKKRVVSEVEKLQDFMSTNNVLMMNGYDQEMVPDDIQPAIKSGALNTKEITVTQANPVSYLQSVKDCNPDLISLEGSLYSGRFISVFPGVMSCRMYLKQQNDKAESALFKVAEPLSSISWLLGQEYGSLMFNKALELLLQNHPHDSICGCSIDDVHSDMENRFRDVHFLVDSEIDSDLKQIIGSVDTSTLDSDPSFVFNTSPYSKNVVAKINDSYKFVKDVPAMGYKLVEDSQSSEANVVVLDNVISNGYVKVVINHNGSLDITNLETGKVYKNLGIIEDKGDAGDEYNYSYPDNDKTFVSTDFIPTIEFRECCENRAEVLISHDMILPQRISDDRKSRVDDTLVMPVRTKVVVEKGSKVVKFNTTINNTVRDHLVRVLFESNIESDFAYAGSAFDIVKRPIHIDDYDESMIPENVRKVIVGAREAKPNTIFLARELVDINDGVNGCAILSKGLPEYTVIENKNTIALTLFRSVGWVATDINTRIGDAGPLIYTPEAQCLRTMEFSYGFFAHSGDVEEANVLKRADEFNSQTLLIETNKHSGNLPLESSFFNIESDNDEVILSSFKLSEDKTSLIIRVYNGSTKTTNATFSLAQQIKKAEIVNLIEDKIRDLDFDTNTIKMEIGAKSIETLKVMVKREECSKPLDSDIECWLIDDREIIDLSEYERYPLVTEEEVKKEEERAKDMESGLDDVLTRRTSLEAKLSSILAHDRLNESLTHSLGYQLNEARVKRRVHDYIQDLK